MLSNFQFCSLSSGSFSGTSGLSFWDGVGSRCGMVTLGSDGFALKPWTRVTVLPLRQVPPCL